MQEDAAAESNVLCPQHQLRRIESARLLLQPGAAFRSGKRFQLLELFAAALMCIYCRAQVQWLLGLAHQACTLSGSFTDPQQLCTAIINDVSETGMLNQHTTEADIQAGWGRAVCIILSRLADAALEREPPVLKRPVQRSGM